MTEPRTPVRSVLVATDFSENAAVALNWAAAIARAGEARITILHVAHCTSIASLPLKIQERIDQSLSTLATPFEAGSVPVTTRWRSGKPWEVIAAESRDHDLVVVGARGQTPRAIHVLGIGSTADRVMRSCAVPVLTVHADDSFTGILPRRVLIPIDFSETADRALDAVVQILPPTGAQPLEITLLHAWQPLVEYEDGYGVMLLPSRGADSESQARELLDDRAAKLRSDTMHVMAVVRAGYPAKVIEEEASAIDAELIAVGTHGHSGLSRAMLGSVAERVVHRTSCPILSVGPACDLAPARAVDAATTTPAL